MLFSGLWEEPWDSPEEGWVLGVEGWVVVAWPEGAVVVLGVEEASGLAVVVEEPEPQAAMAIARVAVARAVSDLGTSGRALPPK